MRSIRISIFLILLTSASLSAQESKIYPHEVGTLATGILERFFNFETRYQLQANNSFHQVTYKRHFNQFSLRTGISGNWQSGERTTEADLSPEKMAFKNNQLYLRLGIEKQIPVGNRWNGYYGFELRYQYLKLLEEEQDLNPQYRFGFERTRKALGLAAIVGLEFKISSRLALQTETSLYNYFYKNKENFFNEPIVDNPTFDPSDRKNIKGNGFRSEFVPPFFVIISIRI